MDQVPVYKAMRTEFNYVTPDDDLRSALPKLRETRTKNLLVMNGHSLKGGILSLDMIKSGMDVNSLKVSDVMSTDVPTIRYDANIHEALDRLIRSDRGILAVIDEDNTTVKGIIGLPDIAEAYNREIRRIKHELMQGEG
ncbi:CBS domain-containing protein [Thermogymnomonas acidicola]|uniref:CBS domain-containing protein n=1 Tax=Thermogymnomonas acidicola TaxID=399579 RepID=UPI001493FDF4|nr:CBS domain-containing protein [Thermogymnomonas acidicola]